MGRGRGAGDSQLSVAALFVSMAADREGERPGHFFLSRFRRPIFTGCIGGEKVVSANLHSNRRRFRCHARSSPKLERVLFHSFGHSSFNERGLGGMGFSAALYPWRWLFWQEK